MLTSCKGVLANRVDTQLNQVEVSEIVWKEIRDNPKFEQLSDPLEIEFDKQGNYKSQLVES